MLKINKIKVLSLFSGIGAFEKALDRNGIDYELVNYCEIDKYASKSYSLIHNVGEDKNLVDVTKVNTDLLPKDLDLVTYGFPCVPKGYMIKVENGYKAIEDITNNDIVLTHTNTYKKVVKTMKRISDHINHIKLTGCQDLQLTDEHPLYVLRNGEFTWVKAKDLNTETDYLCYNINNKAIPCDYSDDVLWLIGRYFADGYKENHSLHRPIFCIGKKKIEEFETHIKPFKFSVAHSERSAVEYKITDDYLCGIFSSLTTGSTTKEIPQWIVDLPKQQLEMFYKGYFSGDGHSRKDRELYMFCTASKNMFLALQDIVIKLYNVVPTVSIRHDNRKATYNDTYNVQYSYRPKDQIVKDNKVCVKIKDVIRELKDIEVFNFEVEEDNSYTVNNVIVHNCQDISQAGKQKGFADENGERTRSGLFFEALRIIEGTKPKVAIAENVKALTSKKFDKEFNIVLDSLDNIGYNNYYKVLNAKDYGIPQNRERVFIVSIRKDVDDKSFLFPNPFKLDLRLKDLLEDDVDEKYYLKDEQIKRIKTTSYMSGQRRIQEKDWCDTLCARDWKDPKCVRVFGLYDTDKIKRQAGGVYDPNGISSSLDTMQGGNRQPFIITHNIKQQVTVRKHEVDIDNLKSVLKDSKNLSGLSCKDIAQKLDVPLTNVEHWFRSDNCFSIPSADIWFKLKDLLNIKDDSFDKTITEFEVVDGKFEMADRVYDSQGISPTLTSTLVPSVIGGVGEKTFGKQYTQGNRIYDSNCVSPALQASNGGASGGSTLILDEAHNPKDNYESEPQIIRDEPLQIDGWHRNAKEVLNPSGLCRTLSTQSNNLCTKVTDPINYRVRKLTPKECWRLMGFDDKDIDVCIENNTSNSQLYKQAGNSIVVNVLQHIFENLFSK